MTSITESNIDDFKTEHECDEHWELRRKFLLAHKDKFQLDELICFAQVFTNMEFLGCRYPRETMRIVNELSTEVVGDYRERQKTRLRRTFVGAADAASSKVKGQNRQSNPINASTASSSSNASPQKRQDLYSNFKSPASSSSNASPQKRQDLYSNFKSPASSTETSSNNRQDLHSNFKRKQELTTQEKNAGPKQKRPIALRLAKAVDVVLFEYINDNAQTIISRAASSYDLNLEWEIFNEGTGYVCDILFNRSKLASATADSQNDAKKEASELALVEMKRHYYTIKVTKNLTPTVGDDLGLQGDSKPNSDAIGSDNIGSKMMKLMGWSGGGLGKSSQGIVEPVCVQEQMTREGLGLKPGMYNMGVFKKKCTEVLRNYMNGDTSSDLVFTPCFTNEERALIHQIAKVLGLKSRSYGPKTQRTLTISRKIHPQELVNELLQLGGSTEKYQLIEPTG